MTTPHPEGLFREGMRLLVASLAAEVGYRLSCVRAAFAAWSA